jgi:hypothetical protein
MPNSSSIKMSSSGSPSAMITNKIDATSPSSNAAIIGGAVGASVALLLIIGIIAFIVWRRGQRSTVADDDVAVMKASPSPHSDYGPIGIPQPLAYNDVDDVRQRI